MGVFRSVSALISSGFPAIHDMTHCEFVLAKSRCKSESRENMRSDDGTFSQEYFVYCKKK